MCGICGVVSLDGRPVGETEVEAMLPSLERRGPDASGVWSAGGGILGHRRLAIVDLEGGGQPMLSADGRRGIAHNGEIYGFPRLRDELERRGFVFRTRSDTEVILHGWEAWGEDVVDHLDGMFAFALWDATRRRLLLARDRFGEKPLFWTEVAGRLVFGSTLTSVLAHPAVTPAIDPAALAQYLVFEHVPAPGSLVRGIHKLPPGGRLRFEDGRIRVDRWWRPTVSVPQARAAPELDELLRHSLVASVKDRLGADVPVGILLSGGIDSAGVTAAAVAGGATRIETFTMAMDRPGWDESAAARQIARHLGTQHSERPLTEADALAVVPRLGEILDEPIGDSSIVPTWLVSRMARSRVKVVLGGDGGDELFAGYPTYLAHRWTEAIARFLPATAIPWLQQAAERLPVSHAYQSLDFRLKRWARHLGVAPARRTALWMSAVDPSELGALLGTSLADGDLFAALDESWPGTVGRGSDMERAQVQDQAVLLPLILAKVDRASMWHGLEVRAPFLARAMVEVAASLPARERIRGRRGKVALRRALRPWLPAQILDAPKQGFAMPIGAWLRGPLGGLAEEKIFGPHSLVREGWLRETILRRWFEEHRRGLVDHRKALWTLLVLELWRSRNGHPLPASAAPDS